MASISLYSSKSIPTRNSTHRLPLSKGSHRLPPLVHSDLQLPSTPSCIAPIASAASDCGQFLHTRHPTRYASTIAHTEKSLIPDIPTRREVIFALRFPNGDKKQVRMQDSQSLQAVLSIIRSYLGDASHMYSLLVHNLSTEAPDMTAPILTPNDTAVSSGTLHTKKIALNGMHGERTVRQVQLEGQVATVCIEPRVPKHPTRTRTGIKSRSTVAP
ncbi:hypothetical protein BASA50_005575 [Batrachochytrium salamandrivorans]|uniref:UBX domain-containing protein n=1 Tax=Batrachochytrium salamandrivorans TaxID=1357716 RepID=A0ABQ8FFA0_9FUNG|nr:hypothetical protein BASA60_006988 [Batrachochytrium salamandrivorans]KAH6577470.1 hypothetical protein BASA62_000847 [Batrachochytrium salamandrivorans]KAH6581590.1 hypothetical protein BASA61_009009 [Batrachochytrium salamandrivorans]KAH6595848.1 hypothetical protein BASA50_005575 [Batrachochytrium salamandrivorans]KAH9270821.1 hypothetical protein BASA83_006972 [Batrachochytrium salamandrivorans]